MAISSAKASNQRLRHLPTNEIAVWTISGGMGGDRTNGSQGRGPPAGDPSDAHAPKPTSAEPFVCSVVRYETTPCKGKGLVGIGDTGLEPVTSRV